MMALTRCASVRRTPVSVRYSAAPLTGDELDREPLRDHCDGIQRIADLVRHAGGEFAEGGELFGALQFALDRAGSSGWR